MKIDNSVYNNNSNNNNYNINTNNNIIIVTATTVTIITIIMTVFLLKWNAFSSNKVFLVKLTLSKLT